METLIDISQDSSERHSQKPFKKGLKRRKTYNNPEFPLPKSFRSIDFTSDIDPPDPDPSSLSSSRREMELFSREKCLEMPEIPVDLSVSPSLYMTYQKSDLTPLFSKPEIDYFPSISPFFDYEKRGLDAFSSPNSKNAYNFPSFSPYFYSFTPTTAASSLPSFSPNGPLHRTAKGLKTLSGKVYSLLRNKGACSYKDVADCLLMEKNCGDVRDMEEKNVRRRVYDAINVLLAAEMLVKVGKNVKVARNMRKKSAKEVKIEGKMEDLRELVEKYRNLQALIQRNQREESRERWYAPFWLVTSTGNSKELTIQSRQGELHILSSSPLSVLSDSSLLSQAVPRSTDATMDLQTRCAELLSCPFYC